MELRCLYLMFLFLSCFVPVILMACPYPTCDCRGHFILCNSKGLASLPALTTGSYRGNWQLDMSDNRITKILGHSLPANLSSLDLRFNPITEISPEAFDDSTKSLKVLKFRSAKFTMMPTALLNLRTLKTLWMEFTPIAEWNIDILKHLGLSLNELFLTGVGLTSWPQWIAEFSSLKNLKLTNLRLSNIPENSLNHLRHVLKNLIISGGTFTHLPKVAFSHVPKALSVFENLTNLDLSQNQLENVEGLPKSAPLATLDLSSNKLSNGQCNIAKHLLPYNDSLEILILDRNRLAVIPDLDQMIKLSVVKLDINQISDPTTGSFPSTVTALDLGNNKLPSIPKVVSKMRQILDLRLNYNKITEIHYTQIPRELEQLDMSNNYITRLNDASFPRNSSLCELNLNSNPLVGISHVAFRNLSNLRYLKLGFTKLTKVPSVLIYLPKLSVLSMYENSQLICIYSESQLTGWFRSHMARGMSVFGSCGVVVYNTFFITVNIRSFFYCTV